MASPSRELDILLVGRTGNGKSSTGNSITRRKSFEAKNKMGSVTKKAQIEYSEYKGRVLKVVDTPGLKDTCMGKTSAYEMVLYAVNQAMEASPQGYHAILIVVKFGDKFGEENVETILLLKKIFGEGFIENHSILVFTCGDVFEEDEDVQENNMTLEDWIEAQSEVETFTKLAKACGHRRIIFNNKAKDETKQDEQLDKLIQMIDNFTVDGRRYTNEQFKQVEKARQRMYEDPDRPFLKEEFLQKTALITQQLGRLTNNISTSSPVCVLDELNKMKVETDDLYLAVEMHDNGKGSLKVAMTTISKLKADIDEEMNIIDHLQHNSEQEAVLKEEIENKRLESEANERKRKEEQERRDRELQQQQETQKLKEAESRQKLEKWQKEIEEEKKRIRDENERAKEEEKKKEESHRLLLEKERQILEKERKEFEDEKARVELRAQIAAQEAAKIQRMKEEEEERRRKDELLRIHMEDLLQEEERLRREEYERRAKEKKEREEYEARKREEEEAERKRKKKEEEEIRRKEKELKRLEEEKRKAIEEAERRERESEQRYQEMKNGYSRGVIGTLTDGISWATGSAWSFVFGSSN